MNFHTGRKNGHVSLVHIHWRRKEAGGQGGTKFFHKLKKNCCLPLLISPLFVYPIMIISPNVPSNFRGHWHISLPLVRLQWRRKDMGTKNSPRDWKKLYLVHVNKSVLCLSHNDNVPTCPPQLPRPLAHYFTHCSK